MIALVIGGAQDTPNDQLRDAAIASVGTGISAIFILFAVGALTGAWAMSGTLMAIGLLRLQILSPNYFYMTTALICGLGRVQHRQLMDGRRDHRHRARRYRRQHGTEPGRDGRCR